MSDSHSALIHTKHLSKEVLSGDSKISILKDINLSVMQGESVAILGASGSGKTTLLTLLAGLDVPTNGKIYFNQQDFTQLTEEQRTKIRAESIGFIFQSFYLLPNLTALENVMLPLEIRYTPNRIATAKATEWLERVNLKQRLHHYPTQLSGGEQQRVAIARAFVNQPHIIFADEMTGNLDSDTGKHIADLLFSLNNQPKTTLVLVTHDESLAQRCHQRYWLEQGILKPC